MRSRSKNRSPLYRKSAFNALIAGLILGFGSAAFSDQVADLDISINAATLTTDAEELGATTESGALESIFLLEKALVYDIIRQAGLDPDKLSPATKAAIDKLQTTNLEAFLAFARGLDLLDQGRYAEAQSGFQQAAELDPQFAVAVQYRDTTPLIQEQAGDIAEASIKEAQQTPPAVTAPSSGNDSGGSKESDGEPKDGSAGGPEAAPKAAGKSPATVAPKNGSASGSEATASDSSAGEAAAAESENALGGGSEAAPKDSAGGKGPPVASPEEAAGDEVTTEPLAESPPPEPLAESPPPEPLVGSPPPQPLV
ncbi:MAG: hypothetical protein ACRED0_05495, partial [Gammaproteobacteria bacterium]